MSKYNFIEISKTDVSHLIEKKGKFNYLSWSHATEELLKLDQFASWEYKEPLTLPDGSMMVFCTVKAFDKEMTAQLPVIDFKNQAIKNPNSMQLNTAMQRCLAKAIALYGLGLFVFQGEDLPPHDLLEHIENIYKEQGVASARQYFNGLTEADRALCLPFIKKVKESE